MRLSLGLVGMVLAGCSGGLSSGGAGQNTCEAGIVGTTNTWDQDCGNNPSFRDCCTSQGGVNAGVCYGTPTSCTDEGSRCYPPPAQPQGEQFLCDGALLCEGSQFCVTADVPMGGCSYPQCVPFPPACANDRTCQCLIRNNAASSGNCNENIRGQVFMRDDGRY